MTSDDVRAKLAEEANGNRAAWAKAHGISAQYVNDVLVGRREPGAAILTALGLRREVIYRKARA